VIYVTCLETTIIFAHFVNVIVVFSFSLIPAGKILRMNTIEKVTRAIHECAKKFRQILIMALFSFSELERELCVFWF